MLANLISLTYVLATSITAFRADTEDNKFRAGGTLPIIRLLLVQCRQSAIDRLSWQHLLSSPELVE